MIAPGDDGPAGGCVAAGKILCHMYVSSLFPQMSLPYSTILRRRGQRVISISPRVCSRPPPRAGGGILRKGGAAENTYGPPPSEGRDARRRPGGRRGMRGNGAPLYSGNRSARTAEASLTAACKAAKKSKSILRPLQLHKPLRPPGVKPAQQRAAGRQQRQRAHRQRPRPAHRAGQHHRQRAAAYGRGHAAEGGEHGRG